MDCVVADGVGLRLGQRWLFRGVDLRVSAGECVAVVGPNGSGKSTLLRCLYGEEQVSEGHVVVEGGIPDERSAEFRRAVSVLLDDSDTFAELTPRQHVELLLGSFGGGPDGGAEPEDLLSGAGLDGHADVPAGRLSAGQRRRLLLLGATARPHRVLLLDEPERALDADGRRWLAELLAEAKNGTAVVMATHHRALVRAIADRVVTL